MDTQEAFERYLKLIPQDTFVVDQYTYMDDETRSLMSLIWKDNNRSLRLFRFNGYLRFRNEGVMGSILYELKPTVQIEEAIYCYHKNVSIDFKETHGGVVVRHKDCNAANNNCVNLEIICFNMLQHKREISETPQYTPIKPFFDLFVDPLTKKFRRGISKKLFMSLASGRRLHKKYDYCEGNNATCYTSIGLKEWRHMCEDCLVFVIKISEMSSSPFYWQGVGFRGVCMNNNLKFLYDELNNLITDN